MYQRGVDLPAGMERPMGFQRLAGVSMLLVNQKVEYMEALTGFETANQYTVLNEHGHPTFHAAEVSNWMSRNFLGKNRPFTLNVVNPDGSPFLVIDRPWRWFYHELCVKDAAGAVLGYITRTCSVCSRDYTISDRDRQPILKIAGPCYTPWTFNIRAMDGMEIGHIKKKWSGLAKEFFTDADNFGVSFSPDLALHVKALILAAVFLIDFMYFEDNAGKNNFNKR